MRAGQTDGQSGSYMDFISISGAYKLYNMEQTLTNFFCISVDENPSRTAVTYIRYFFLYMSLRT